MLHLTSRGERWFVAAIFVVGLVVALPNVCFFGRSLVPSDNLNPFDYRLLSQNYGPALLRAPEFRERGLLAYPNFHDISASLFQAEPGLVFLRDALRDREFPFWDPYVGAGTPALANLTCAFLFPPELLLALAGGTSALKNLYALLIMWTAAFATYVILRQHGIGPTAAVAGGLAFMMSGALQQSGSLLFKGQAIAMIPVVLAATRWFLNRPTWKRTAALSLLFAVVAQASFPPLLLAAFGFASIYVIVFLVRSDRHRRPVIAKRFMAAAGMSLGMAAFLYVPAMSALAAAPHARNYYDSAAQVTLRPRAMFQLFAPTATGGTRVYENAVMDDSDRSLYYVGAVALLLAVIGTARGRPATGVLWWACVVTAALSLMKMFGIPPIEWISYVPGFRTVHFASYFGMLLALLIALLAGIGLDRLFDRDVDDVSIAAAIAYAAWSMVGLWSLSRMEQIFFKADEWRWIADFQVMIVFAGVCSALLIVMRVARSDRIRAVAGYALVAALFLEGVTNTTFPRQSRFDAFQHLPPYVRAMQRLPETGRFFTSRVLDANLGSATKIRQVESLYTFQLTRLYEIYVTYTQPPPPETFFVRGASILPPDRVLDRMNVAYVAVRPSAAPSRQIDDEARRRGYPVAWQDDYARIYRRDTSPRVQFSSSYQVAGRTDALHLIATAPADRVILETQPDFPSTDNRDDDPRPEIVSARRNRLTVRVSAPRSGLLYLSDTWFPGWTATVNGRPAPVLLANYAFRAVALPAGAAIIDFNYWPAGLTLGLVISSIGAVAAIVCCFAPDDEATGKSMPAVDDRPVAV